MEEVKDVILSAYVAPELKERFVAYAKKHAQGNISFALRCAIEKFLESVGF